jgi:DMSO/TMAO reductase YedYZ molybdopterin-dependent catalytic subunit
VAGPNVGRTLETGSILGALTVFLAATGALLSPTLGLTRGYGNVLYVAHLAAAVLLVVFLAWHLWPYTYAFVKKAGQTLVERWMSLTLLALLLVEVATGYVIWAHDYRIVPKEIGVGTHLVTTAILLVPLGVHAARGLKVWRARRAARREAVDAADAAGRGEAARRAHRGAARRAFLRVSAYAVAGVALAYAFGSAAKAQVQSWRLNSIGRTPQITKESYRLRVTGLVNAPVTLSFADLQSMQRTTFQMTHHCVEGWTYSDTFRGVLLSDVLARAGGVKPGAKMLIFKSPETSLDPLTYGQQYTTNFPYTDQAARDALVAFEVGGHDLPPQHGFPVRLMTPRKWGYKACKWLVEIEASDDASYQGYWEQNGYNDNGDYPGPIFA